VVICDDSMTFPVLARRWLQEEGDIEVVAVCATAGALLEQARIDAPDVVLLDVVLPDSETPGSTIAELRRIAPACGVLLCSGTTPKEVARIAAEAGAQGGISKAMTPDGLRSAVRAAAGGTAAA